MNLNDIRDFSYSQLKKIYNINLKNKSYNKILHIVKKNNK